MAKREIVGVRVKLGDADEIRKLSYGEVKKPETINYRTLKPERDGLFCERIFGPTKSYECACGKYKKSGPKFQGVVCDHCGVEVTDKSVRRERMGHIELAAPVVHLWYLRGTPSRLSLLLGTPTKDLEKVIYFAANRRREEAYLVVIEGKYPEVAPKGRVISESERRCLSHYDRKFRAEVAYRLLTVDDIDLEEGNIISTPQITRLAGEYGEDSFTVEPAWVVSDAGDSGLAVGEILSESRLAELRGAGVKLEVERAKAGNNEQFVVMSVNHLPFKKNDVVSATEHDLFCGKYPGRFTSQKESVVVEDACYLVISSGDSPFAEGEVIVGCEQRICSRYDKKFKANYGAEGVREILKGIDTDHLAQELREELSEAKGQKRRKIVKRLQVVEEFRRGGCRPESMVLDVLPVIPPDLRPMVQLDGGRFATSDLNDLYRRVINRNNRLLRLKDTRAPQLMQHNEKRMLQEAVDSLIDNNRQSKNGKVVLGAGNRPLKSLTDLLRGKKGRFRQNLLGKRVDYSGRSVIAIGPFLKLHQCGLPKRMALELFKPFVVQKLVERGIATNVKNGKKLIERAKNDAIWDILEEIIKDHPVLLNRAPTLHRLGIQAFEPILMEGQAIRLHPMACAAFNADFDGDQMAVHVPLSIEAQTEARMLMLSSNNLLSPASGKPIVSPTQDILLGLYHITNMIEGKPGQDHYFRDMDSVMAALDHEIVHVNSRIYLRWDESWHLLLSGGDKFLDDGRKWLITTPGRILFNQLLPKALRFVNIQMGKKDLSRLLDIAFDLVGHNDLVNMLDSIKNLGYHWAGVSGISFQMQAIVIPKEKAKVVDESQKVDSEIREEYDMGILTEDEYLDQKEKLWSGAAKKIGDAILEQMDRNNPIRMMIESGARGSRAQLAQMAGIRGVMADPTGRIIDYPITTNFREGMNMLEYFISTHGARKGLADTALRTAKSGYLTRRLVDVAQDIIVLEEDCHTNKGVKIEPLIKDGKIVIPLSDRVTGRTSLEDVDDENGRVVTKNELITRAQAKRLDDMGRDHLWVRSPMTCESPNGICRKCYGVDLSARRTVGIGEAVGIVAAQSIGEPGTQLTMRTFHTGGVRTGEDITQGLPRIEQLFEARRPKKVAVLAGLNGVVLEIRELGGKRKVIIEGTAPGSDVVRRETYTVPGAQALRVTEGQTVTAQTELTDGYIDPQQLLEVMGLEAVQKYLVDSIQEVYESQGVSINNKHIEVILRKVAPINRVKITDEGDTSFVAGEFAWTSDVEKEIEEIKASNEKNLTEAVESLKGKKLSDRGGALKGLLPDGAFDKPVTEDVLRKVLAPGGAVTELYFTDEEGPLRVVVGEAAFRKEMRGMELVEAVTKGDKVVPADEPLTVAQLSVITQGAPVPHMFRSVEKLRKQQDEGYVAEAVIAESGVLAKADQLLTEDLIEQIRRSSAPSVKIWKTVDTISVRDLLQERLINRIWGRQLKLAIGADGQALSGSVHMVDGSVVKGIVEGQIQGLVFADDSNTSRETELTEALSSVVSGKVLLEDVKNSDGTVALQAGQEIGKKQLAKIVAADPTILTVRPVLDQTETVQLISRVSFVRRLRLGPQWRPFIHGVTKAALATDSFLSAASFQQTAQILAGAAVRNQVDHLMGLKENVIIGHLIPAGTGIERFQSVSVERRKGSDEPVAVEETACAAEDSCGETTDV